MKNRLCAFAAGLMVTGCGTAVAGESAVVYGRADVSYQNESYKYGADQDGNTFILKSNASRIGVKGAKELDGDLKAIYQLEWEVSFTDKDSKNGDGDNILKARNSFVGITGEYGTLVAGTHDTPLKKAQGKIDLFNDLEGDIKNVLLGENRVNNVLQYSSPKLMDGLVATLAVVPGEEQEVGEVEVNNSVADSVSASLIYKTGDLFAAVAMDDSVGGVDTLRISGQYKIEDAKLGMIYQMSESSAGSTVDDDGIILSLSYKLGSEVLKFQYGASDMKAKGTEQVSFGVDHKVAKGTKFYAFLTNTTTDDDADEEMIIAAGIQHKF